MWEVIVRQRDGEEIHLSFADRPGVSEGPCLFRIVADEGEIWFPANQVEEVRVKPNAPQPLAAERTGL